MRGGGREGIGRKGERERLNREERGEKEMRKGEREILNREERGEEKGGKGENE